MLGFAFGSVVLTCLLVQRFSIEVQLDASRRWFLPRAAVVAVMFFAGSFYPLHMAYEFLDTGVAVNHSRSGDHFFHRSEEPVGFWVTFLFTYLIANGIIAVSYYLLRMYVLSLVRDLRGRKGRD